MSTEPFVPYRLCCGQQHHGVVCPDNLVMCCLCFDRVPISGLSSDDGELIDVCIPCAAAEEARK